MTSVFFGCSMRGGYPNASREELQEIVDLIEGLGHAIVSRHQTEGDWSIKEARLSDTEIHDRDYEWLVKCEAGVFEISNPSLGVGAEISDLLRLGKPVLCLYKQVLEGSVSAYVRGKMGSRHVKTPFECRSYGSMAQAAEIIQDFLERHSGGK